MAGRKRKHVALTLPSKARHFMPGEKSSKIPKAFKNSAFTRTLPASGGMILRRQNSAICKKVEKEIDTLDEWLSIIENERSALGIHPDQDCSTMLSNVYLHRAICGIESTGCSEKMRRTMSEAYYMLYLASKGQELPAPSPSCFRLLWTCMAKLEEMMNAMRRKGLLDANIQFLKNFKRSRITSDRKTTKCQTEPSSSLPDEWKTMPGMNILGMSKALLQRIPKEYFPRVEIAPGTVLKEAPSINYQKNIEMKTPEKVYSTPGPKEHCKPTLLTGTSKMSLSDEEDGNIEVEKNVKIAMSDDESKEFFVGLHTEEEPNRPGAASLLHPDHCKGKSLGRLVMLKENAQELMSSRRRKADSEPFLSLKNNCENAADASSIKMNMDVDMEFGVIN